MKQHLFEYFDVESRHISLAEGPLPMNTLFDGVSSTYLNGFINYVTIQSAFVLSKYHKRDEDLSYYKDVIHAYNDKDSKLEEVPVVSKKQVYDVLINKGTPHPCINHFYDDVVILAKAYFGVESISPYVWVFFYYNRDCSDSSVGRFQTKDPDKDVLMSFSSYAHELSVYANDELAVEIPVDYFQGWISD